MASPNVPWRPTIGPSAGRCYKQKSFFLQLYSVYTIQRIQCTTLYTLPLRAPELSAVLLRPQRSPPPGRQHSNFTRQRRRESPNQPARIPVCTRGSWPTTDGGELAMAASAVLDKVLLAPQLSKAVHALAAPPLAYASMSALPSSFSRRCSCACAGISSMAQYSFTTAPR